MQKLILLSMLSLLSNVAFAETIHFKSGKTLEGKIIEKTDKYIKVDPGIGMGVTYFLDEIQNITGENIAVPLSPGTTSDIGADNLYSLQAHGLSIQILKEWKVLDRKNMENLIAEVGDLEVVGTLCIFKKDLAATSPKIILKCNILDQNYTFDDYFALLKERHHRMAQSNPDIKIIEDMHVVTRDGQKYIKNVLNAEDQDGQYYAGAYYTFLRGDVSYSLTCPVLANQFDTYKDVFEKTAASLKFEGPEKNVFDLFDAEDLSAYALKYYSSQQWDKSIEFSKRALQKAPDENFKAEMFFNLSSNNLEKGILPYMNNQDDTFFKGIVPV